MAGDAAATRTGPVQGLLGDETFWTKESGAPLLRRNAGYLSRPLADPIVARVAGWPALCEAEAEAREAEGACEDEAAHRIFVRDAERTFRDEEHQKAMIRLLTRVWPENKDYHQGLGYVSSLLMLLFDEDVCVRMLLKLTREERYTPGYWRAAPDAYVRDAMVYARLVEERFPEVSSLLTAACIVPEAYASKWFIGLCIHVLPFKPLFDFVEAFFEEGYLFLFKFALALIEATSDRLLSYKPTDVNKILEVLRLDAELYPDSLEEEDGFFSAIVASAKAVQLEPEQVASLRAEEAEKLEEKMRKAREREAALAAESDDEIVFSDEEED